MAANQNTSQICETVLDDKSIDFVTIATPNHWHSLAAIWAMQAGKDVYVEKPVSHNVSEGRRDVQAAEHTAHLPGRHAKSFLARHQRSGRVYESAASSAK